MPLKGNPILIGIGPSSIHGEKQMIGGRVQPLQSELRSADTKSKLVSRWRCGLETPGIRCLRENTGGVDYGGEVSRICARARSLDYAG